MSLYLKSNSDIEAIITGPDYAAIAEARKRQIAVHFELMPANLWAVCLGIETATMTDAEKNFTQALFSDAPTNPGGGTTTPPTTPTSTGGDLTDKTFTINVAWPAAGQYYAVGLNFAANGAYAAADFAAILTANDARIHISRDTNAQRDGHSTGWTMFVPPGVAPAPVGSGGAAVPLVLTALVSGGNWTAATAPAAPTWTGPTLIDTGIGVTPGGFSPGITSVGDGAVGSLEMLDFTGYTVPTLIQVRCPEIGVAGGGNALQDWMLEPAGGRSADTLNVPPHVQPDPANPLVLHRYR